MHVSAPRGDQRSLCHEEQDPRCKQHSMEVQEWRPRWRTEQLLAIAMLVGTAVAVAAAKRGQVPELPLPLELLAVPLGNLAIFAVQVAVGLYNRRKRDSHKRLMMLATIVTAGAALDRLLLPTGVLAFSSLPLNTLTSMSLTAVFLSVCFSAT